MKNAFTKDKFILLIQLFAGFFPPAVASQKKATVTDTVISRSEVQQWFEGLSVSAQEQLRGMWIKNLPPARLTWPELQIAKANSVTLGQAMFFDVSLSKDGNTSCASCHDPAKEYTDGKRLAIARDGSGSLAKNTPSLASAARQPFLLWNGAKDSVFAQMSIPIFHSKEHALNLDTLKNRVFDAPNYRDVLCQNKTISECRKVFSAQDVFVFVALQVEAFVASLSFAPTKIDSFIANIVDKNWQKAENVFDKKERAGLKIFLEQGFCVTCHSGPLLSDGGFHNIGVPLAFAEEDQSAWIDGAEQLLSDKWNCKNREKLLNSFGRKWKKVSLVAGQCQDLTFLPRNKEHQIGAFRTPALRNVALTSPYMHGGQFANLQQVVEHYSHAISFSVGESRLVPLNLSAQQREELVSFLLTLNSVTISHVK